MASPALIIRLGCVAAFMSAAPGITNAGENCTCRAYGRDFKLSQSTCLATPRGFRLATCAIFLNNTSWNFSDIACVIARSLSANAPDTTSQASASHRHDGWIIAAF